jgi:hypothetical protein
MLQCDGLIFLILGGEVEQTVQYDMECDEDLAPTQAYCMEADGNKAQCHCHRWALSIKI